MFRGRYDHTIDGKGRLSIPANFRQWLAANGENQLIVTNFIFKDKNCLDVYPFGEWQKLEQDILQQQKNSDPDMVAFSKLLFEHRDAMRTGCPRSDSHSARLA